MQRTCLEEEARSSLCLQEVSASSFAPSGGYILVELRRGKGRCWVALGHRAEGSLRAKLVWESPEPGCQASQTPRPFSPEMFCGSKHLVQEKGLHSQGSLLLPSPMPQALRCLPQGRKQPEAWEIPHGADARPPSHLRPP